MVQFRISFCLYVEYVEKNFPLCHIQVNAHVERVHFPFMKVATLGIKIWFRLFVLKGPQKRRYIETGVSGRALPGASGPVGLKAHQIERGQPGAKKNHRYRVLELNTSLSVWVVD